MTKYSTLIPIRKCFKIPSMLFFFLCVSLIFLLHENNGSSSSSSTEEFVIAPALPVTNVSCHQEEFPSDEYLKDSLDPTDTRPRPTVQRLEKLFAKLISYEEKFQTIFDALQIFRWSDLQNSLRPFPNQNERFEEIFCLFQRYLSHSNRTHVHVPPSFIDYLKKISNYLANGFTQSHPSWLKRSESNWIQPVIVLAANARFYDTLQASMKTIDQYLPNHTVVIYDLGFNPSQLAMIELNCQRCRIIPFPFSLFDSVASHLRILGNFAWKPIVIQDAVRRFGSILYGDTSVRYQRSNFDRLFIDNLLRGFACRELPGHYLPCFTLSQTFHWFEENSSNFEEIYIAEAGFLAVTDNFLSRLILKSWSTCAFDAQCISPINSQTSCRRLQGTFQTHRFDQSAMVTVLSFFFFPSLRQNEKSQPAAYDMFTSIQEQIAQVRRFEGIDNYFTRKAS